MQRSIPHTEKLKDYHMFPDDAISEDGELVHFSLMSEVEPVQFEEAMKEEVWIEAMKEELKAIKRNRTWDLVSLPE